MVSWTTFFCRDPYFLGWADIFSGKKGTEKSLFIVLLKQHNIFIITMGFIYFVLLGVRGGGDGKNNKKIIEISGSSYSPSN